MGAIQTDKEHVAAQVIAGCNFVETENSVVSDVIYLWTVRGETARNVYLVANAIDAVFRKRVACVKNVS